MFFWVLCNMRVTSNCVLMLWFAPSSKPVTLTLSRARCQIKSELLHFKALADDPDFEYVMLDSTIVRAHQHAAGAKGGLKIRPSGARAGG